MAELLDIGGDRDGFDLVELESALLTPIAELFGRAGIGGARVAIEDAGGKNSMNRRKRILNVRLHPRAASPGNSRCP